ncbi:MAG: arginase family protein [Bacteroidales bacterium]|jgi:arginase family enzyme|nr:arginase family protein [Bacteroidales bacterium]
MNLEDYLIPIEESLIPPGKGKTGHHIIMHNGSGLKIPATAKIAILGVPEDRFSDCAGEIKLPEQIRKQLYVLSAGSPGDVVDLGNLRTGNTLTDTYFGLQHVLSEMATLQIVTLIAGGTSDLIYGGFLAFESQHPTVTVISPYLRLPDRENRHPLNTVIYRSDNSSSHFCNIGYHSYYADREDLDYMKERFYETCRLGEATDNIRNCEPVVRDTDLLALSMNAVKYADAPAASLPSPNGFTGEEVCQLAYYAGLGNRCKCMGVFDALPQNDLQNITVKLAAQIAWYFIEGVKHRNAEHPKNEPYNFKKYTILHDKHNFQLCFFKNIKTERWWLEVPSADGNPEYISCSPSDYAKATEQEIPDRWWKMYCKLNKLNKQ